MEVKFELYRSLNQLQEKYIFYLIILSFVAIGFSVYLTMGRPMVLEQLPLGLAILSWAIGIYFGTRYIRKTIDAKTLNFDMLKLEGNRAAMSAADYAARSAELEEDDQLIHLQAVRNLKWQEVLFFTGLTLFLAWHVLEMAVTSLF